VPDHPGEKPAPPTARLILAYTSVFLVWGSTYLAIRIGVRDFPPALFAGLRFLVAGSAMFAYGWLRGRPLPKSGPAILVQSVVGISLLVGGNGLVVWSEQWIHSGIAALMVASVPLFMSTLDAVIPGGHRLSGSGWFGILLGFAGVAFLVWPAFSEVSGDLRPEGIVGLLLASFFWSAGSVYSKRKSVGGDVLMNTAMQMLAGGVVLLLIAVVTGEPGRVSVTQDGVLALLYLIVAGSIIGFTSYVYLLHHVPPAKASTYAYVNPVVAILLGAFVLSEPLTARTLIAAAVILGGVAIVQIARARTSAPPAKA